MERFPPEELKYTYDLKKDRISKGDFGVVCKAKVTSGVSEPGMRYVVKVMEIADNPKWKREVENMIAFEGVPGIVQYVTHKDSPEESWGGGHSTGLQLFESFCQLGTQV